MRGCEAMYDIIKKINVKQRYDCKQRILYYERYARSPKNKQQNGMKITEFRHVPQPMTIILSGATGKLKNWERNHYIERMQFASCSSLCQEKFSIEPQ